MQIKIPLAVVRAADRFCDVANKTIWRRGKFDFRYVDAWTAVGGLFCVGYYFYFGGWFGALQGALLYILVCMIALWMF